MKWEKIKEFPDYAVSDIGLIKRIVSNGYNALPGSFIKLCKKKQGYCQVNLHKDKKRFTRLVHRLVLIAFIGKPPEKTECNHKNGNKADNRVENLEWITSSENSKHAYNTGLSNIRHLLGENHPVSKLSVVDIQKIHKLLISGVFQKTIANMFGITQGHVSDIKRGKRWAHLQC